MYELLANALSDLGCPVLNGWAAEGYERYFVYNESSIPREYADDRPVVEQTSLMLHYFCPLDYNPAADKKAYKAAAV